MNADNITAWFPNRLVGPELNPAWIEHTVDLSCCDHSQASLSWDMSLLLVHTLSHDPWIKLETPLRLRVGMKTHMQMLDKLQEFRMCLEDVVVFLFLSCSGMQRSFT